MGIFKELDKILKVVAPDYDGGFLGSDIKDKKNEFPYDSTYSLKNIFKDNSISLKQGAIVFCKLAGEFEPTGIFIGDNQIIELNGDGYIKKVSINEFLNSSLIRTGLDLYTFVDKDNDLLYSYSFYLNAKDILNSRRNYNVAFDNCHQFTSGCITNNFENDNNFFWMLKDVVEKHFGCKPYIVKVKN